MKAEEAKLHVRKEKNGGEAQFDIFSKDPLVDLQENDPILVRVRVLMTEDSIEGQSYAGELSLLLHSLSSRGWK